MWRDNSLSIVLTVLFIGSLAGHALFGWQSQNAERLQHGRASSSFGAYLVSSDFGEATFENWESEFLQMACYVLLTVILRQRGSSESKRHDGKDEVEADPAEHRLDPDAPGPVRAGGWRLAVYKHSLSLAFVVLFLGSFVGHAITGAGRYEEEQRLHGIAGEVTTLDYLQTPRFWAESFENWQSEFLAVLAIVVLSIHLRQWGSPESKPVHAPHHSTGR